MHTAITEEVTFEGAGTIRAWVSRPDAPGRHPAVALLHGINGVSDGFKLVGQRFAEEGFVGLAIDRMNGEEGANSRPANLRTVEGAAKFLRTLDYVDPARIAVAGYCQGGGLTFQSLGMFSDFSAGVAWHGGVYPHSRAAVPEQGALDVVEGVNAPLLIIHGASDASVPIEHIYEYTRKLNELGKRFELKIYSGTDHAFTLPGGAKYVAENAEDAFREGVLFLRRVYGMPLGEVGPLVREPVTA